MKIVRGAVLKPGASGSLYNATINGGGTSIIAQGWQTNFVSDVLSTHTMAHAWLFRFAQAIGGGAKLGVNASVGGSQMGVGANNFRYVQVPKLAQAVRGQVNPVLVFCGGTNDVPIAANAALTLAERNVICNDAREGLRQVLSANPNTQIYWILMPPCVSKNQGSLDQLNADFIRIAIQEFGIMPIDLGAFMNSAGTRNWDPAYSSDEVHPDTALGRDMFSKTFLRQVGRGTTPPMPRLIPFNGKRTAGTFHRNLINGVFDNTAPTATPTNWGVWGSDTLTNIIQSRVISPNVQSENRLHPGYLHRITAQSSAAGQSFARFTNADSGLVVPGAKLRLTGMINIAAMTNAQVTIQAQGFDVGLFGQYTPTSFPLYQHTELTNGLVPFEHEFVVSSNAAVNSCLLVLSLTSLATGANIDFSYQLSLTEAV